MGPVHKLNGQTEKCIIDQVDAIVSRAKQRIRFSYRVINPQPRPTVFLPVSFGKHFFSAVKNVLVACWQNPHKAPVAKLEHREL